MFSRSARIRVRLFFAASSALAMAACATILAPSGSTINLTAGSTTISTNVATTLVATVLDQNGTSVQDGTRVTFETTMGQVSPPQARTRSGTATTQFISGQIGTATVKATSGNTISNSIAITIGQAITVSISATPNPATVNTNVTFTATVNPSNTTIDHYEWTFGDSGNATTTTASTQHVYTTTGTMTVTVKAVTSGTSGPTGQIQVVVQ